MKEIPYFSYSLNLYENFINPMQLWQPQMIMLIQYTVGLENFVPPLGIVVVLSAVSAALLGKLMDKHGKDKFFIPLVVSGVIGGLFDERSLAKAVVGKNVSPL